MDLPPRASFAFSNATERTASCPHPETPQASFFAGIGPDDDKPDIRKLAGYSRGGRNITAAARETTNTAAIIASSVAPSGPGDGTAMLSTWSEDVVKVGR